MSIFWKPISQEKKCEINFFYPSTNEYYRALFFLYEDENSGHVMAFVVSRVITQVENELFTTSGERKNKLHEETEYFYKSHWNGDEVTRKYLSKLIDSSRFLMFLLNNAIELASLEKGIGTLKESLANADRFYEMMDAVTEGAMKERNLHFSRKIHIEHSNVMCDTMKLRIIYLNLLSNSMKYTPSGGSISWDLEEIPSNREGYALYKTVISDTGIGISPDFLPHIFEDFSREKNSTVSDVLGAGLGMSVVKKLVDLMGGRIAVESRLGKGTSVTVIIPHRIVEREELLGLTKAKSDIPRKIIENKRILLAEDNDLNAEIAVMILSDVGFICELVVDGTEAVAAIENKPVGYYDLVLMDIQMPIMDGYKATRMIRQLKGEKSRIPIFAMTANVLEEDKRMALAAGMNGHIAKPIDIDKLMDALFSVIE